MLGTNIILLSLQYITLSIFFAQYNVFIIKHANIWLPLYFKIVKMYLRRLFDKKHLIAKEKNRDIDFSLSARRTKRKEWKSFMMNHHYEFGIFCYASRFVLDGRKNSGTLAWNQIKERFTDYQAMWSK